MRRVALPVVLLAVLAGATLPAVGLDAPPSPDTPQGTEGVDSVRPADDVGGVAGAVQSIGDGTATEITIAVQSDADARWTVRTQYRLETENDTRAFQQLLTDLRANEANASEGAELFRNYAAQAERATGREMNVTNVSYRGTIDDAETDPGDDYEKVGNLTLAFTWTNFSATTDGGRLRVGDAFSAPDGGLWFPSLSNDQRLVFVTPDGYYVDRSTVSSETRGDRRVIDEARQFDPGVWFVYAPEGGGSGETAPDRAGGLLGAVDPALGAGVAIAIALIAGAAYVLTRRDDDGSTGDGAATADGSRGGAAAGGEAGGDAADADRRDEFDLSLLSDEERVEYLLEHNGGRMRQAAIVEGTGWSDAKVSQLLSAMASDDRVNKLRIGRENLISLPDHDPADDPRPDEAGRSGSDGIEGDDADGASDGASV